MSYELPRQFARYAVVGAFGTLLDVLLFWALIQLHVWTAVAVTAAFFLATAAQFFLNRHWSFRSFHRSVIVQAKTYTLVTIANWIVALLFVEAGTNLFHLSPLVAKALSIPPSGVLGFIANRYLTFGRPR